MTASPAPSDPEPERARPSAGAGSAPRGRARGASAAPPRPPSRRTVLLAGGGAVAALAATAAVGSPRPAPLGEPTGDRELAEALRPRLAGQRRVAIALLDGGAPRFAGFGADENREFEIGSVSKTFTGALVMDAVDRGELSLDTKVGEILGPTAGGAPIASRTMRELITHTAGIPRLPQSLLLRSLATTPLRKNPYADYRTDELIEDAVEAELEPPGAFAYSNFGTALAGALVARAAGGEWRTLLRDRVLSPLRLDRTRVPTSVAELGPEPTTGRTPSGRRAAPWPQDAIAPAGGIRSTAADIARYVASRAGADDPKALGLEPLARADERRSIGANWLIERLDTDETAIWHNGETGGFHSFCGWVRESGRGVVLLSDTADGAIDAVGMDVLAGKAAA